MKNKLWNSSWTILLLMLFTGSCKKDETIPQSVSDVDGNVYPTVVIGNQVWFSKNIITTKYNDGTTIPMVFDDMEWSALTTAGCRWNSPEYGLVYNWYAVSSDKLCPAGWHVPTRDDWNQLIHFLDPTSTNGNSLLAGGMLKESSLTYWASPNTGATNVTGFTALPSGERAFTGQFTGQGTMSEFWLSTNSTLELKADAAWMVHNEAKSYAEPRTKGNGFAVRCIRN